MHVRKQMPLTTSQILSDQRLRRPSTLHQAAMIPRHRGRWLPPGIKSWLTPSVRLIRRKLSALPSKHELIERRPLQQLRRPCASLMPGCNRHKHDIRFHSGALQCGS